MQYQKELLKTEKLTKYAQSQTKAVYRKDSQDSEDSGVGYEKTSKSAQSATSGTCSSSKQHNLRKT